MSSVPWFETPLMNAVQRDLAGWPSEKLSERSALLRLNDATAVTFSVRQKRLFMASIHSCEFVVEYGDPARSRQDPRPPIRLAKTPANPLYRQ